MKGYSGPFRKREGNPRAKKSLYRIAWLVWARVSNAIGISLIPGGLLLLWWFWFVWLTTKCSVNLPDLSDNGRLCFTPAGGDLVLLWVYFSFFLFAQNPMNFITFQIINPNPAVCFMELNWPSWKRESNNKAEPPGRHSFNAIYRMKSRPWRVWSLRGYKEMGRERIISITLMMVSEEVARWSWGKPCSSTQILLPPGQRFLVQHHLFFALNGYLLTHSDLFKNLTGASRKTFNSLSRD